MSEWKEVELSELINFGNGKKKPESEGDIPIYGGNGILGFSADSNYENETIIIGRVGAYCGSVYYENKPIWVSDNALAAKAKNGYSTKFLYYFLKNANLNQHAGGSSHPLVTQTLLNSLEYEVCIDEVEQNSIAEVLSSLDDKIDLLHRQNQTLEQMAETLFRQWFVEEENESWKELKLENVLNVVSGFNHKQEELDELGQGNILLSMGSIQKSFGLNTDSIRSIVSERVRENQYCYPNDIIITTRDVTQAAEHLGSPVLIPTFFSDKKIVLGSNLYKLEINESLVPASLIYFLLKSPLYRQYVKDVASGTSILMLKKADLLEFSFSIPEKLNENKIQILDDLIEKLNSNYSQIRRLAKIRDSLLPKLMSGEVRITY